MRDRDMLATGSTLDHLNSFWNLEPDQLPDETTFTDRLSEPDDLTSLTL